MIDRISNVFLASVCLLLSACQTMSSTPGIEVDASANWLLLPVSNFSSTPQAGETVSTLIENNLRVDGVQRIHAWAPEAQLSLASMMNSRAQVQDAREWGTANGYRYGVTGAVHEWHYKSGADREPAVGLTLKILDLQEDRVLWQSTAARTGWGYSNLSSVADKTVNSLIRQLRMIDTSVDQ